LEGEARISVQEAAKRMGVTPRFLQISLQYNKFPFGVAVKMTKRWAYYINRQRFEYYMGGGEAGE